MITVRTRASYSIAMIPSILNFSTVYCIIQFYDTFPCLIIIQKSSTGTVLTAGIYIVTC